MDVKPVKIIRAWMDGLGRKLTKQEVNRLRRVWDSVPHVRCKGLCADQCTTVPIAPVETYYLIEKYGAVIEPHAHRSALRRDGHVLPTLGPGKACPFLMEGRCSIYEDRPMVCRAYGHPVATLACEHGCTVKRPITLERLAGYFIELARAFDSAIRRDQDLMSGLASFDEQVNEMVILAESEDDDETVSSTDAVPAHAGGAV